MALQQQSTFVCDHLVTSEVADGSRATQSLLRVGGEVDRERLLTLDALRDLPAVTVAVPDRDSSQPATTHTCTGVLLRDIVQHAGLREDTTRNNDRCGKYVAVIASDGYCVTLAYCDLLAPFSQQQAMLAYAIDGQSAQTLADLVLILPDDPIACRRVKHVETILVGDPRASQASGSGD